MKKEGLSRVSSNPLIADHKFQSPQTVYAKGGMSAIIEDTKEKFTISLGIHLNLAPVADVSFQETDFIYDRTFGQDAESTADYISTVVTTMNEEGISSTLKHFRDTAIMRILIQVSLMTIDR